MRPLTGLAESSSASDHHHLLASGSLSPMLACTRLPTPAPPEPRLSESANTGSNRRMLTVLTSNSATAGSSSIYAVNGDGALPSPLPSPRDGASSSSTKTAAFFGSPFATSASPAIVPPHAPTRAGSLSNSSMTPKVDVAPPTRSATADFFAISGSSYRPTPPSSIRSGESSREGSPPRLPPLARFFPSRYAAQDRDLHDNDTDRFGYSTYDSRSNLKGGADWETSFKREFIQLTEAAAQAAPTSTTSPLTPSTSYITSSPTRMETSPPQSAALLMTPPTQDHHLPSVGSTMTHAKLAEAAHHAHPIRRETHVVKAPTPVMKSNVFDASEQHDPSSSTPHSGTRLESGSAALTLVRALGEGAFSSVWLATDDTPSTLAAAPLANPQHLSTGLRRKSSSWAKRRSDKHLDGIKPITTVADRVRDDTDERSSGEGSVLLDEQDGEGASAALTRVLPRVKASEKEGRLVAVKMLNRALCDANDRTRISFVREVEVLRVCMLLLYSFFFSMLRSCLISYLASLDTTLLLHAAALRPLRSISRIRI